MARKITLAPLRFKRLINRKFYEARSFDGKFSILANSFPKSGTHLLLQVLSGLPVTYYGAFLASMPSVTFRERSKNRHIALINKIVPGELIPGHLFYDENYANALMEKRCIQYFIYRDPRDVVVSEVYYLTFMNRWHRLHKYFSKLDSVEERLTFCILGNRGPLKVPYDYPDIRERFMRYAGWLSRGDVFSLRFEDLNSERRDQIVFDIVQYYINKTGASYDVEYVARKCISNIDPSRSHTFRSGRIGQWRKVFKEYHVEIFKDVAGDLLEMLGYDWSS